LGTRDSEFLGGRRLKERIDNHAIADSAALLKVLAVEAIASGGCSGSDDQGVVESPTFISDRFWTRKPQSAKRRSIAA
jgi:hypothetical protein